MVIQGARLLLSLPDAPAPLLPVRGERVVCNALKVIHFRAEKVIQPGTFYLIFFFPPPAAARGLCFGCGDDRYGRG